MNFQKIWGVFLTTLDQERQFIIALKDKPSPEKMKQVFLDYAKRDPNPEYFPHVSESLENDPEWILTTEEIELVVD